MCRSSKLYGCDRLISRAVTEPGGRALWRAWYFQSLGELRIHLKKGALGVVTTATLEGREWVLNGETVRGLLHRGSARSAHSCVRLMQWTDLGHK